MQQQDQNPEKDFINIRISAKAWELTRWAKFQLNSKSYSDTINSMESNLNKSGLNQQLTKYLKIFDSSKHSVVSSKIRESKPKTILISNTTHKFLERVKLISNEPSFTFSDVLDFLITTSGLTPEHLKK